MDMMAFNFQSSLDEFLNSLFTFINELLNGIFGFLASLFSGISIIFPEM